MKLHRFVLYLTLAILTTMSIGCTANADEKEEEQEAVASLPVEAKSIVSGEIAAHLTGPVTLVTEEDADIVAKASGVVKSIMTEEGQWVKRGQLLAKLEDDRESYQLEQAKATLMQLKADYERNKELISMELVSAETYERSKFAYEAQVAVYNLAKLELQYTGITAPFAGVIAVRQIKVGNMVSINQSAFRIINYKNLKAELHLPEIDLAKLRLGQASNLTVDALPGRMFTGQVGLISPVVDPASGTVKVTVHIDNADLALKPGMFGPPG